MFSATRPKPTFGTDERPAGSSNSSRFGPRAIAGCILYLATFAGATAAPEVHGLPFARSYSLEDIGYGPKGASLDFDRFGRVTVIHDGVYSVLNDSVWLNLAARKAPDQIPMMNVVRGPDGRMYYCGGPSWGVAEVQSDGLLHPVPLVPPHPPSWVQSTSFTDLIVTSDGVYIVSPNGIVFWDAARKENQLFECARISRAFRVGRTVYVSAFERPLSYIDTRRHALVTAPPSELDHNVVVLATILDETRSLVSLLDGRLLVFDGRTLSPWEAQSRHNVSGEISALHHLVDGHIAVGVIGKGLLLFSPEGELVLSLDTPQYHRVTALASHEPGVLWAATEDGIEKVLYSSSLTTFGQQLGLTVGWPIIESWKGNLFVASEGKLYRAKKGLPGAPTRFELYPQQPARGAWALAACGPHMLVGGTDVVYAVEPDGSLRSVADVGDLAHLVMIDAAHCYAIGRAEIALLQWQNGNWTEAVPRTRGVTYPSVVHRAGNSAWLEMGGQVGRLWLRGGKLQLDLVPNSSWTKKQWVNVGVVDNIVVLSAGEGERRFFDESRGSWCEAPELRQLLGRSPIWLARMQKDEKGTIWATYNDGVIRFMPQGNGYEIDTSRFDLINDRYPQVHVLPGNEVWIFASQSLYHVEQRWTAAKRRVSPPILVSLVDAHGDERLTSERNPSEPFRLPYTKQGLTLRFFSGSDARRRAPTYEYQLSDHEPWTTMAGSQIGFRALYEGKYNLRVRMLEKNGPSSAITTVPFEVLPPWYRTWPAYMIYGSVGLLLLFGATRWSNYLERRRSRILEQVVHERTCQLEATMDKLGEESKNAATLAERDRLANEIHDSVQQGLTGAILQLETTLKLPAINGEVRSRLDVVRNMVSYARQEVQHAVWDMESPLLKGNELSDALRNLTTFANLGEACVAVSVSGESVHLDRTTSHNLLRVAQEATTNAFRHAKAHQIKIHLEYQPESVRLDIVDDGIGFCPKAILQEKVGHLGLRGIRTRVKRLGGRLDIQSSPDGGGTAIRVEVPIPSQQEPPNDADPDSH